MFGRFMPTEGKFFEYFNQHADCAVTAAHELEALVNDLPNAEGHARRVQATEKKADRITHDTIDLLHKTFITPLDRDEIHKLITTMDDILDLMEDVAETISRDRRQAPDQAEGDLRAAGVHHRQVRGRGKHHRRHRPGKRLRPALACRQYK